MTVALQPSMRKHRAAATVRLHKSHLETGRGADCSSPACAAPPAPGRPPADSAPAAAPWPHAPPSRPPQTPADGWQTFACTMCTVQVMTSRHTPPPWQQCRQLTPNNGVRLPKDTTELCIKAAHIPRCMQALRAGLGSPAVGVRQEGHQRANSPGDADVHRGVRRQDAVGALQPMEVEAQRHRQQLQPMNNTCHRSA